MTPERWVALAQRYVERLRRFDAERATDAARVTARGQLPLAREFQTIREHVQALLEDTEELIAVLTTKSNGQPKKVSP